MVAACLRFSVRVCVIGLLTVAFAGEARAQASLEVPLQFDFLNPGARSLALGSAFTGLADDATSAFTNPAGLVILRFPEVSFEGRFRHFESTFLQGGRLSGTVTNQGIDTVNGAVYGQSNDDSAGLSYLSVVIPRGKWAVAGYRHEFVRVDQEFTANGVFQGAAIRELALQATREMDVTAYGGSAAFQANPRVSVGGSVVFYTMKLDALFNRYTSPFFGAPTFAGNTNIGRAAQSADSTGVGFNLGGLFTLKQGAVAGGSHTGPDVVLGVTYRQSPKLAFTGFDGDINAPQPRNGDFQAPDALTAGLAVKFAQGATLTVDVARMNYETLMDGYVAAQTQTSGKGANFSIENANEFHAGFEYVMPVNMAPALRVGTWYDPDHSLHYTVPANPDVTDLRFGAYLPGGDNVTHFTFGGGVSVSKQFEVNAGADFSSRSRIFSVSAVVRFAK